MADDRYTWLDEETAERLLRGLPVDAQGNRGTRTPNPEEQNPPERDIRRGKSERHAPKSGERPNGEGSWDVPSDAWFEDADRRTADRLASALGELAAEHSTPPQAARGATSVELPGEAAALSAFRAARFGVLQSGSVGVAGAGAESGGDSASGSASGDAAPADASSRRRLRGRTGGRAGREGHGGRRSARSLIAGRPLRAGFAMALAGCALGGVAVAAGAGVLPTPFGGGGTPTVNVSPVASPSGEETDGGGGEGDERGHDTAGDHHGGKHRSGDPDSEDGKGEKDGENDVAASGSESGSPRTPGGDGGNGARERDDDRDERHGSRPGSGNGDNGDKKAIAAALCRAYSEGRISAGDRRKLERAAGGRAVVQKFCARHGLPPAASGGLANGGGGSGGGHNGGGSGGDGGDGGGPGESGGSGGEDDSGGVGGGDGGSSGAPSVPGTSGATGTTGGSGTSGSGGGTAGTSGTSGSSGGADGAVTGATSGN